MAVTDSQDAGSPPHTGIGARVRAWLADGSDRSMAQRTAGAAFLIRVASAGLLYLSQVVLARWMGSFEFGVYVYVWTWVLLIGTFADFGLAIAAQRFIPEYVERKAFDLLRGFLAGSRWLVIGIATLIAGLGALGVKLIEPWLDHYLVVPLYLACASLPFYTLAGMLDGIARSYGWVNLALVPPYIGRPLVLIAVMATAHVAGLPANATTAMIAAVISTWVNAVIQLVMVDRRLTTKVERGPKAYAIRTWFATAIPIFMVGSFFLLLTYVDTLLLQHFRSPDEVAVYYAAAKTLALVAFIHYSIAATTAHRFSVYHVAGDHKALSAFLAQSIKWTFWPSVAATAVLLLFGRPILALFGAEFTDGYHLMFILAAGLLARAAIGPIERLLNMLGEQRVCAMVYAGAFTLNVVLCVILIPRLGPAGAAIATATALIVESILLFIVTKKRLGFHVFIWGRAKRQDH